MPAYTTSGGPVPDERSLDLPGYPGGTDVVGNWVNQQFQLDAFGESLLLFAAAAGHDHLDADGWRAAEVAVAAIEQRWREPDAGIWELEPDHWTHSRLICAAGLRRIAAHQSSERAAAWLALADAIVAETAAHARAPVRALAALTRATRASTRRCCCRRSEAAIPPTIRGRSRRWRRSSASSPRTATATATAPTSGRWARPRARL